MTLGSLIPGDVLAIKGATSGSTLTASNIQDLSQQEAYTQINGAVLLVSHPAATITLRVTASEGQNAAFQRADIVRVIVRPTTAVTLRNGTAGTASQVRAGMRLTLYGLSDRATKTVLAPQGITQIAASGARTLSKVAPTTP